MIETYTSFIIHIHFFVNFYIKFNSNFIINGNKKMCRFCVWVFLWLFYYYFVGAVADLFQNFFKLHSDSSQMSSIIKFCVPFFNSGIHHKIVYQLLKTKIAWNEMEKSMNPQHYVLKTGLGSWAFHWKIVVEWFPNRKFALYWKKD